MELVRPEAHTGPTPALPYDRSKECDVPFSDSTLVAKHRAHTLLRLIDRARRVTSLLLVAALARLDAIFLGFCFPISWGLGKQDYRYGDLRRIRRCPISCELAVCLRGEPGSCLKGDLTFGVVGVTLSRAGQRTPLHAPSVPPVRGLTHLYKGLISSDISFSPTTLYIACLDEFLDKGLCFVFSPGE